MKLRMQITKDKDIRFISHLEYVRTIGRAIRRAKLPAAYSEGFNPHLKFSLASALGVGVVWFGTAGRNGGYRTPQIVPQ